MKMNTQKQISSYLRTSQIDVPCSIFSRFFSNQKSMFLVHYSSSIDVPCSIFSRFFSNHKSVFLVHYSKVPKEDFGNENGLFDIKKIK